MFLAAYFLAKMALIDPWWLQVLFWLAVADAVAFALELLPRLAQAILSIVSLADF